MRSVNAQAQAGSARAVRDSTRTKAKSRIPSARGGRRASSDSSLGYGEALRARLGWFGSAVLFRRPILSLTLMLVLGGGVLDSSRAANCRASAKESKSSMAQAGFAVGDISLAGADRTSTADVYAALGVERGQSIFTVDVAEVRARLLDLPWVAMPKSGAIFPVRSPSA